MTSRRVIVTERNGRSVIIENADAPQNRFESVPGFDSPTIWGTSPNPKVPWDGLDITATTATVMPPIGGTRLLVVTFPPDSVMAGPNFDPLAAQNEYLKRLPGLAELFERDNPGMHKTDTIDYDIVLDGEIAVEFDDGVTVNLSKGDVVVQYGTRHAWRNRSSRVATVAFVLIGAKRAAV